MHRGTCTYQGLVGGSGDGRAEKEQKQPTASPRHCSVLSKTHEYAAGAHRWQKKLLSDRRRASQSGIAVERSYQDIIDIWLFFSQRRADKKEDSAKQQQGQSFSHSEGVIAADKMK